MTIDDLEAAMAQQVAALAKTNAELVAVLKSIKAGGDGGGGGTDPPLPPVLDLYKPMVPARFAGMGEIWRLNGDERPALNGWDLFNGPPKQNNEGGYFQPGNFVNRDGLLVLETRRQKMGTLDYTAAMMENTNLRVGRGKPWFVSSLLGWDEYWGPWVGWWLYNLATQKEIDGVESVNKIGPTFNAHITQNGPQLGSKSTKPNATFDVGPLHHYGVGCDTTGLYTYVDGVELMVNGPWWSAQFLNAQMWPKLQHSLLGWWPRDDAARKGVNIDFELAQTALPNELRMAHFVALEAS